MPIGTPNAVAVSRQGDALAVDFNSWTAVRCLAIQSASANRLAQDAIGADDQFWIDMAGVAEQSVTGVRDLFVGATGVLGQGISWGLSTLMPWILVGAFVILNSKAGTEVAKRYRVNPPRRRRTNPLGRVEGIIPGRLEEIRYRRAGAHRGPYKHTFKNPARIVAMRDGSLSIRPRGRTRLWGYY